ncbi:MAG TPA: hypothetical protein VMY34_03780, partial [Acidimicrobiales bacterium]|nr:hypothetical protein [Acidimicrobiales bacterium]
EVAPEAALADLEGELRSLLESTNGFTDEDWSSPLLFDDAGIQGHFHSSGLRDLHGGVLHVIHDASHHLGDIKRGLSRSTQP